MDEDAAESKGFRGVALRSKTIPRRVPCTLVHSRKLFALAYRFRRSPRLSCERPNNTRNDHLPTNDSRLPEKVSERKEFPSMVEHACLFSRARIYGTRLGKLALVVKYIQYYTPKPFGSQSKASIHCIATSIALLHCSRARPHTRQYLISYLSLLVHAFSLANTSFPTPPQLSLPPPSSIPPPLSIPPPHIYVSSATPFNAGPSDVPPRSGNGSIVHASVEAVVCTEYFHRARRPVYFVS